ncbi:sulfite exporter TauE/SafE family protein [Georgenia sp. TF02-10]|uniref:sulfite exporter TauE/SafE family protein n=1 Tax=Georgenia sp. TF02-10 TaxID=2917725 RepID=UPI001FA80A22|nr:sulfite exporter TauE/SafE family protein [Georgenia sp. TF02-10]UNX55409.1 sulfite exporter TauE/SafE family protein [Georgenia sp. TF02-10]
MATAVLSALIGLGVGAVVGALGAGGGILTVPVLVYLLGFQPYPATTASLVIVGATALAALVTHARAGHVRWARGLAFGALAGVWTFLSSHLAEAVDPALLMSLLALLLAVVAVLMLRQARRPQGRRRGSSTRPAGSRPTAPAGGGADRAGGAPVRRVLLLVAAAAGTGLLTGFFGVGGGFAVVPVLVLVLGLPMQTAVGTSMVVLVINAGTGLAARGPSLAALDWPPVLAFAAASMVGSVVGARLARRMSPAALTTAFAVLLALVAVWTAVQAVPDLV